MAMWRVLRKLDIGKGRVLHPGSLSTLDWIDRRGLARLEMRGAISKVSAPPLAILPGWVLRSQRLSEMDIEYVDQFLETDTKEISDGIGASEKAVEVWKDDVVRWITADEQGHS